ncbi:5'/3'-nucleotidase SurE [Candidatus Palauibacter sp.]|uniref:5'/3'-nucleotidase SurE n=1 Tax=Candidatus Palauibacter sp. TaxID=3101350 RepID=UPI003B01DE0E
MTDPARPVLLCTNDDGVQAGGLALLAGVAESFGDVWTVAPDREQSATSHALSLYRPLRLTRLDDRRYMVDGTPTDCVLVALKEILETPPRFVLSGVNHGPNMGEDVLYSGTVAAAMEATILGVPAVAFSFTGDDETVLETYGDLLGGLIRSCLRRTEFPEETFLNVNLPNRPASEVEGVVVTALGRRVYIDSLRRSRDEHGHDYFRIGGGHSAWRGREDSDFRAVRAGYVSVTPLHLDLTNFELLNEVRSWGLGS